MCFKELFFIAFSENALIHPIAVERKKYTHLSQHLLPGVIGALCICHLQAMHMSELAHLALAWFLAGTGV